MPKLLTALVISMSLVTAPVYAEHGDRDNRNHRENRHHEHYKHNQHADDNGSAWAGIALIGAIAGLALLADRDQPAYKQAAYVEPGYPAYSPPQPASDIWYYCQSSAMYYPYAKACPEGRQAVPAGGY